MNTLKTIFKSDRAQVLLFLSAFLLTMSDGVWFPLPNLTGILLMGLLGVLSAGRLDVKGCRSHTKGFCPKALPLVRILAGRSPFPAREWAIRHFSEFASKPAGRGGLKSSGLRGGL